MFISNIFWLTNFKPKLSVIQKQKHALLYIPYIYPFFFVIYIFHIHVVKVAKVAPLQYAFTLHLLMGYLVLLHVQVAHFLYMLAPSPPSHSIAYDDINHHGSPLLPCLNLQQVDQWWPLWTYKMYEFEFFICTLRLQKMCQLWIIQKIMIL